MLRFPINRGFSSSESLPFGVIVVDEVESVAFLLVSFSSRASSVVGIANMAASTRTMKRCKRLVLIFVQLLSDEVDARPLEPLNARPTDWAHWLRVYHKCNSGER